MCECNTLPSREHSKNSLADFMKVNCDTTIRLATGAANAGVRRFIYISSIGVLGGETKGVNVFSEESKYNPQDTYSVSKMKAELGLKRLSESVNMEIVIIRPPLVYGACAPGNFNRLLWITSLGIPLPFKGMKAKKSMISLKNLCDLIMMAIVAPLPKFSVFVASDDSCWSTSELVLLISKYMGKKCRLFEVNPTILIVIASLLGRKKEVRKLSTSLCIDASKTLTLLNWSPIQAPEEGLREAIESYSSCSKSK